MLILLHGVPLMANFSLFKIKATVETGAMLLPEDQMDKTLEELRGKLKSLGLAVLSITRMDVGVAQPEEPVDAKDPWSFRGQAREQILARPLCLDTCHGPRGTETGLPAVHVENLPSQIVIVRKRRMITARITMVRLPRTGLPYELTRTWAPPRTSAASARFRSDTPATRTSMKALMSQGTPRFGWTLTSRVLIPSACASSSFMITARATMPICVRCITSHTATPRTTASSSSTRRYSEYVAPPTFIARPIALSAKWISRPKYSVMSCTTMMLSPHVARMVSSGRA